MTSASVLDGSKRLYTLTMTEYRKLVEVSKSGVENRQDKVNAVWKRVEGRAGGFYAVTVARGPGRTFWAVPRKAAS